MPERHAHGILDPLIIIFCAIKVRQNRKFSVLTQTSVLCRPSPPKYNTLNCTMRPASMVSTMCHVPSQLPFRFHFLSHHCFAKTRKQTSLSYVLVSLSYLYMTPIVSNHSQSPRMNFRLTGIVRRTMFRFRQAMQVEGLKLNGSANQTFFLHTS